MSGGLDLAATRHDHMKPDPEVRFKLSRLEISMSQRFLDRHSLVRDAATNRLGPDGVLYFGATKVWYRVAGLAVGLGWTVAILARTILPSVWVGVGCTALGVVLVVFANLRNVTAMRFEKARSAENTDDAWS
jgi:hypothetical protein